MKRTTFSIAIVAALLSGSVMAEAWDVTQIATITNATTMEQMGTTINALQSINAVNDSDIALTGSQKVTQSSGLLKLEQKDTVSSSTQAINYTKAKSVATGYTQDLSAKGTTLNQTTTGSKVVQGINIIEATSNGIDATQTITDSATFAMNQKGTEDAIQVGNAAFSGTNSANNKIKQDAAVNQLDMSQENTTNSIQALNYVGSKK